MPSRVSVALSLRPFHERVDPSLRLHLRSPKNACTRLKACDARLLWLPARLSAPLLMRAIKRHAWTFVGAGLFEPKGAWEFEIDRSDAVDPVLLPVSLFHWYAKVFERLYRSLVSQSCSCEFNRSTSEVPCHHNYRILRRRSA